MSLSDVEAQTVRHLASRLIGPETAEETLDRIEKYLSNEFLPPRTAALMALAAIEKWKGQNPDSEEER